LQVSVVSFGDENHPDDGMQFDDHEQRRIGGHGLAFVHIALGDNALLAAAGPTRRYIGVAEPDIGGFQR
jgi:hypothetical protein